MAGEIPPMIVEIQLETAKLKSQMNDLQGEFKKIGSTAGKSSGDLGGMDNGLKKLTGSIKGMLGFAAVAGVLTSSAKAAADDASSMNLLHLQLKASTNATQEQMTAIDGQIQQMQNLTGVADDELRPAFGNLVRVTGDADQSQALLAVALDASAAKGKNVGEVANALAKAQAGNTTQLVRMFPELKKSKDVMGDLAKETKGAAEAAANADPMKQLSVMFQDMQETLGKALLPVLRAFMKILKPLMPIISDLADIITTVVDAVMPLITAIMDALMPAFKAIVKVIKPLLNAILPPLIKLMDKILVPVLIFMSDILVQYLVPAFEGLGNVFGWLLDHVVNFLVDAFNKMLDVLGPLWQFLKPVVDAIMGMLGIKVEPVIAPKVDETAMGKLSDLSDAGLLPTIAGTAPKKGSTPKANTGDSEQVKALKETQKQILQARKDYHKAVKEANDAYAAEIKNQINAFRDVFRQATQINLGDLFSAGNKTADSLVESLKAKLAGITTFAQDIAEIAGAGFSSDFVKEVMGLGPVAGHELAQAIMGATPEVQNQIMELYNSAQDASKNGVNDVATTMTDLFTEATQNLTDALKAATDTLNATLTSLKTNVATTVDKVVPKPTPTPTPTPTPIPTPTPTVIVNTLTNATPGQIATSVIGAVKFGSPLVQTPGVQIWQNWQLNSLTNAPSIPTPITH
jgi:hypothetical protein